MYDTYIYIMCITMISSRIFYIIIKYRIYICRCFGVYGTSITDDVIHAGNKTG